MEAQLPPRVDVLDEVSSGVAFDRRFTRVLDDLLDDPALERTLLLLHASGVDPKRLRSLAQAFDDAWDLVEDRVPDTAPEPPAVSPGVPAIAAEARALVALADECIDDTDKLLARIHEIAAYVDVLVDCGDDDVDLIELLGAGADIVKTSRLGQGGIVAGMQARRGGPGRRCWPPPSRASAAACSRLAPGASAPRCAVTPSTPPTPVDAPASSSSTTSSCWPARS